MPDRSLNASQSQPVLASNGQTEAETSALERDRYPDRNAQIIALRQAGVGPREIARRLRLSANVVAGVLNRHGLSVAPKGRGYARIDAEAAAAIKAARARGISLAALSAEYGVTRDTISEVAGGRGWFRRFAA